MNRSWRERRNCASKGERRTSLAEQAERAREQQLAPSSPTTNPVPPRTAPSTAGSSKSAPLQPPLQNSGLLNTTHQIVWTPGSKPCVFTVKVRPSSSRVSCDSEPSTGGKPSTNSSTGLTVVVIALPNAFTASARPGDGGMLRPRSQAGRPRSWNKRF